jgi:hypothetical protein
MTQNRRFAILLIVVAAFVAVLLFSGLPFGRFAFSAVDAQYVEESATCGFTPQYQVRFLGGVIPFYADSGLVNFAGEFSDLQRQKYFLCTETDTRADGYVAIFFPGNVIRYVDANYVGDIVPRNWNDGQAG